MTEEQAKQIACDYLARTNCRYEKYLGAKLSSPNEPERWIVFFQSKKPPGVIFQSPDLIIIEVDPVTGEAKGFPTL